MATLFANSGDTDQMLHSTASDLGLHCLHFRGLQITWFQHCANEQQRIWSDSTENA